MKRFERKIREKAIKARQVVIRHKTAIYHKAGYDEAKHVNEWKEARQDLAGKEIRVLKGETLLWKR